MQQRTDNIAEVGLHVFERAKLGKAPFRFVGFYTSTYQACPGAPIQPGTSCDYCGTGIMNVCLIRSADNKEFKVGCDCVNKTGEAGLIRAYKTSREYRAHQRDLRKAKDQRVIAEWNAIMADPAKVAVLAEQQVDNFYTGAKQGWMTRAQRVWPMCGASGRAAYLRDAKNILKGAQA